MVREKQESFQRQDAANVEDQQKGPWTEEAEQLLESGKGKESSPVSEPPKRNTTLLIPRFWPSELKTARSWTGVALSRTGFVVIYNWSHRKNYLLFPCYWLALGLQREHLHPDPALRVLGPGRQVHSRSEFHGDPPHSHRHISIPFLLLLPMSRPPEPQSYIVT